MSPSPILRVLLGVSLAAVMSGGRAAAESQDPQEPFDWPAIISRLKQEAY